MSADSSRPKRRINLALQGGGAHGAFTWGVLDRLLEDDSIEIAAISGTSAGALNGAALKSGLVTGGPDGARENLDWLWSTVGRLGSSLPAAWMSLLSPALLSNALENSPAYGMLEAGSGLFSPYDSGPFYTNPLTPIVERFRYDAVCHPGGPPLHICATNVRSGKIRVFTGAGIGVRPILASACLPTLFRAVEIEDPATGRTEAYWDGGYTGNPALFPLFDAALPPDIVVININPLYREEVPRTTRQIENRINEIGFNTSLFRELRAIAFVQRLLDEGMVPPGSMKEVFVHMIADDALMNQLSVATKLVALPPILNALKSAGREAAETFLEVHGEHLNRRGSVDLQAMFN